MLPEVLRLAGLDLRKATDGDLIRIVNDWSLSGEQRFVNGLDEPFKDLAQLAQQCRNRAGIKQAKWPSQKYDGLELRARNISTLRSIWMRRGKDAIRKALAARRPLVVFDSASEATIIAWGHPEFVYVIHSMRRQGIGTALRDALGV